MFILTVSITKCIKVLDPDVVLVALAGQSLPYDPAGQPPLLLSLVDQLLCI